MTDSASFRDRAIALIDELIEMTLKGKIRSSAQIYQRLQADVPPGSGEIFERCLGDRTASLERDAELQTDELRLAKVQRRQRAIKTIQKEWERWQAENAATAQVAAAIQSITAASPDDSLTALVQVMDPNRDRALTLSQWQELAQALDQQASQGHPEMGDDLKSLSTGIKQGLQDWHRLESDLVSWLYDQARGSIGFGGAPGQRGPWAVWGQKVGNPYPKALFETLALEESAVDFAATQPTQSQDWVELMVVLRCLQQGLVNWFDKLVYDSRVGAKLSISTYLAFAVLWSQLASGFNQATGLNSSHRDRMVQSCFQMTLQILRAFALRDYFPLYGGLYASFSGQYLRHTLDYLDQPLKQAEGTAEKARILTLLGYSQRALGRYDTAAEFHQQAVDIARQAGDQVCEIANLNHLSRTDVAQKNYDDAVSTSQRALILARQSGDRTGEANALANLGYSEVFRAKQSSSADEAISDMAPQYLQDGLKLAERLGDRQSQALCLSSLGVVNIMQGQPQVAIPYLEGGSQAAQFSGDLYLQAINLAYLADAQYQLEQTGAAIAAGSLGMYLLHQLASEEWRQPAGLLLIIQGQLGTETFQSLLEQQRSRIIPVIGVDGYDYLPNLLQQFQSES
jgi:tetratricopeptide (TPR) repeat protein